MKKLALAFIASYLIFSADGFAQVPAPIAGVGIPGPGLGPGPRPGGPLGDQGLRPVTTIQGKVVKLQANDDFVFDGFYMLSGSDSLLVKFPAHMGSQVMPAAKTGSQISVSGVLENPPFGIREVRMISLTAGNKTITETTPSILPEPVQETESSGTGKVSTFQMDREGRVSGLFLDNKTVLRFPPHIAAQLGTSIGKGTAISYSGTQKGKTQGEVLLEDYKIIHCNTITVKGQQYLVK